MDMRLEKKNRKTDTYTVIDQLCIKILFDMQKGFCAKCSQKMTGFQLHHKRYGIDISLYDLELVCGSCHSQTHGAKSIKGTERQVKPFIIPQ